MQISVFDKQESWNQAIFLTILRKSIVLCPLDFYLLALDVFTNKLSCPMPSNVVKADFLFLISATKHLLCDEYPIPILLA